MFDPCLWYHRCSTRCLPQIRRWTFSTSSGRRTSCARRLIRRRSSPRRAGAPRPLLPSPLVLLLAFLVAMTFAVNRERIGITVSGDGLLPAASGSGTLLRSYLQEWHPVGGGTASPAAALS